MLEYTPKGLEAAAKFVGCEPAVFAAVVKLESNGRGFDKKGRIKILFEPHKFFLFLNGKDRRLALSKNLARRRWSRKQYADQKHYDSRWQMLNSAEEISETAALKATSWGLGQIMGFNHHLAGYDTVQKMVAEFETGEDEQLMGMARFIVSTGLARAFADKDWPAIARSYNGPGQVQIYANKLESKYIETSGGQLKAPSAQAVKSNWLRMGSEGVAVKRLQKQLNDLGYNVDVDGDFGRETHETLTAIQLGNGLAPDGVVGPKTKTLIYEHLLPKEENSRPFGDIFTLSRPAASGVAVTGFGAVATGIGFVGEDGPISQAPPVAGYLETLKDVGEVAKTTEQAIKPIGSLYKYTRQNADLAIGIFAIVLGLYLTYRAVRAFKTRKWSW